VGWLLAGAVPGFLVGGWLAHTMPLIVFWAVFFFIVVTKVIQTLYEYYQDTQGRKTKDKNSDEYQWLSAGRGSHLSHVPQDRIKKAD
jgi:hypothetical protein